MDKRLFAVRSSNGHVYHGRFNDKMVAKAFRNELQAIAEKANKKVTYHVTIAEDHRRF